jgi:hypothetical protein
VSLKKSLTLRGGLGGARQPRPERAYLRRLPEHPIRNGPMRLWAVSLEGLDDFRFEDVDLVKIDVDGHEEGVWEPGELVASLPSGLKRRRGFPIR